MKRKLKEQIRERMAKHGESYTAARAQILRSQDLLCRTCNTMLKWKVVRELLEPDDDDTDGQVADYMMAMESGDYSNWIGEFDVLWCPKCGPEPVDDEEILVSERHRPTSKQGGRR